MPYVFSVREQRGVESSNAWHCRLQDIMVGDEAAENRHNLEVTYPVTNGIVCNWRALGGGGKSPRSPALTLFNAPSHLASLPHIPFLLPERRRRPCARVVAAAGRTCTACGTTRSARS